uniref:Uncharacterized protein n=1 Tax=Anopheles christyi TaxID=43041 RepID=A0A182KIF5_9DIPT
MPHIKPLPCIRRIDPYPQEQPRQCVTRFIRTSHITGSPDLVNLLGNLESCRHLVFPCTATNRKPETMEQSANSKVHLEKAQNFMRQYRDPESRELKKLSANQFMDVWSHYDRDGE